MDGTLTFNSGKAITPSNTVNFDGTTWSATAAQAPIAAQGLYVGGAGVVVAVWPDGSTSSLTATAGSVLPLRLIRVNSTSTTATLLVALYTI